MSGDTEVTTVITQSQLWPLSQKEKQEHLPFLPECRKHFTTMKFKPATDLLDRSSAFSLSSPFLRCVKTVQTLPAKLYHSVSPAAQLKASITALFPQHHWFQASCSPAVTLHSSLQQHFKDKASGCKQPAASQVPGQAEPCWVLPAFTGQLQHSFQKQSLFLSISPKSKRYTCQSTSVGRWWQIYSEPKPWK